MFLLDLEELSFVEAFAVCLFFMLGIMTLCQVIDMGYEDRARIDYNSSNL